MALAQQDKNECKAKLREIEQAIQSQDSDDGDFVTVTYLTNQFLLLWWSKFGVGPG